MNLQEMMVQKRKTVEDVAQATQTKMLKLFQVHFPEFEVEVRCYGEGYDLVWFHELENRSHCISFDLYEKRWNNGSFCRKSKSSGDWTNKEIKELRDRINKLFITEID